jgi:acyl dehydratase
MSNDGTGRARPPRLNREIVGTQIGTSTVTVTAEATQAYARATNDDNPAYFEGPRIIAPPMFEVVLSALARPHEVMVANGLNVLGERLGLHAEQAMVFTAPIGPGESIVTETSVAAIDEHPRGEIARIASTTRTADGDDRCQSLMSILFIDDRSKLSARPGTTSGEAPPGGAATARMAVEEDQSLRYAVASGDHTATHVDVEVARRFGYPTYLLHGLCTMAFAAKAVVDVAAYGAPARLRRLKVRFSGPVFPGDVLTTSMWRTVRSSELQLETRNQLGERVISGGLAEVSDL